MTKKEIVKTISEEIGLTQLKTKEIVQKTFDAIVEALVEEGRIELRNFGVFEVKKRAARRARNPRTGDKVSVPEKYVVTFKPGKEMEERVRSMEEMTLLGSDRYSDDVAARPTEAHPPKDRDAARGSSVRWASGTPLSPDGGTNGAATHGSPGSPARPEGPHNSRGSV